MWNSPSASIVEMSLNAAIICTGEQWMEIKFMVEIFICKIEIWIAKTATTKNRK